MGFSLGKVLGGVGGFMVGGPLGVLGGAALGNSLGGAFNMPGYSNQSSDLLGQISTDYYRQTQPLRTSLIDRSQNFLSGGLDVTQSPMYGALKSGIEGQYGIARDNIFSSLPQGGALLESLANLEGQRAHSLAQGIGGLAGDELNRAYGLGTGATNQVMSGLSGAGGIQAQLALAQAQQRAGAMQGLGYGLGGLLGALI